MRRTTIIVGIILVIGHVLTETHSILWRIDPSINYKMVKIFIDKSQPAISVHWAIKIIMDSFLDVLLMAILSTLAFKYVSVPLGIICFGYTVYHALDIYFFIFNNKSTPELYWACIILTAMNTLIILLTKYKKLHIVK